MNLFCQSSEMENEVRDKVEVCSCEKWSYNSIISSEVGARCVGTVFVLNVYILAIKSL